MYLLCQQLILYCWKLPLSNLVYLVSPPSTFALNPPIIKKFDQWKLKERIFQKILTSSLYLNEHLIHN